MVKADVFIVYCYLTFPHRLVVVFDQDQLQSADVFRGLHLFTYLVGF